MKPFLKWAGNKYAILDRIRAKLPSGKRLIEPFVGSGALFLNTDYKNNLLADSNDDLIVLYLTLQKEGQEFIDYCRTFFEPEQNEESRYYDWRRIFNSTKEPRLKAALFLYLNRHGYNGLCRYNSKGLFNTPFGRYKKPYFPEKEMLYFFEKARNAVFICSDFSRTMEMARSGDVIYCDPPYVPLSPTANFTSYSTGGFGEEHQLELARMAELISSKGIPVLISNHDTPFIRKTYVVASKSYFLVQRHISCRGSARNKAEEVLALYKKPRKKRL